MDRDQIVALLVSVGSDEEYAETWVNATLDDDEGFFDGLTVEQIRKAYQDWLYSL